MVTFRKLGLAAIAASIVFAANFLLAQKMPATFVPVTDAMLKTPDPADWLMWRRTLDSSGYSPLNSINRNNVSGLSLVWTRSLTTGVQEGTPLVHNGVMFFPNPLDTLQAIDAASGELIWEYKRQLPADLNRYIPFPMINRTNAIYGNLIIDTSADDFLVAIDATTGKLAWETKILDYSKGAQQSGGPITANGKVFSTRGCEPEAGPIACVVTAHDAKTGRELWRTGLIPKPGEPGNETWGNVPYEERRQVGSWMTPSYDPETNLLIVGTSVTAPTPKFMLAGNDKTYLYHNSTLALNGDTGKIVWHYQHLVDHWDLDHPFERLLVETVVRPDRASVPWMNPNIRAGERRRVITGIPGKTGVVYTLDLKTGEFLWAKPTVTQTVINSIDGKGAVTGNPEMLFTAKGQQRLVCPSVNGGKNFQAGAYSPQTNVMYYPLQNSCMNVTSLADTPSVDGTYAVGFDNRLPAGQTNAGSLWAISAETGATLWKYEQRAAMMSVIATGGGILFAGDTNGRFRAFDQTNGKVLWETNLGSAVTGYPATYSVNGRQYVAVSTGSAPAAGGSNRMTADIRAGNANNLYVFALPK